MALSVGPAPSLLAEYPPELRTALETYRASARREIAACERELAKPAAPEDVGTAHAAAGEMYDRELRLAEMSQFKSELCEIEAALGRIRVGLYGLCVDCGRAIPIDRLMARPYASRDLVCAIETERQAAR